MAKIKNQFLIPDDFGIMYRTLTIRQAAERYGVCKRTIRRWQSLARDGLIEAHNEKLRAELKFDSETEEINACLNCMKPRCTGHCDKFPY